MDGHTAAAALLVAWDASQDELRRAFRARAKELHPDAGTQGSESAFIQLREAFDHLMATAPEVVSSTGAPRRQTLPRFEVPAAEPRLITVDLADAQKRRTRLSPTRRSADPDRAARARRFADHLAAANATVTTN